MAVQIVNDLEHGLTDQAKGKLSENCHPDKFGPHLIGNIRQNVYHRAIQELNYPAAIKAFLEADQIKQV
jgi:hypothetical protein